MDLAEIAAPEILWEVVHGNEIRLIKQLDLALKQQFTQVLARSAISATGMAFSGFLNNLASGAGDTLVGVINQPNT